MELIQSIVKYVAHHPWVLLAFIIPALELWIPLVGFEVGGVAAGSLAAVIQSALANIPKGSIFAFLQSYGAGGFAGSAIRMAGVWVGIAVLLAAVGKLLLENGVITEKVGEIVERVWNSTTSEGSLDRYKIEL
ncbi:MAG: hypothetical protein M1840_005213 [Geoglossum simile]|nr:MAG: hypothetical protein M1840_005213 [Geoglossum simile]